MQRKPGILVVFSLTMLLAIGVPSCGFSDYVAIRNVAQIDIIDPANQAFLPSPIVTTIDSLEMVIFSDLSFFTQHINPDLMTEAWATSPPDPIWANEIIDIRVFCDQPIYGISPGVNITPELLFVFESIHKLSLSEYLENLPHKGDMFSGGLSTLNVFFNSKPIPGIYTFTVEIEDNNGNVFSALAPTIEWL